jgi:hypothetical protein
MLEREYREAADAAYDAWMFGGRDYDAAWDKAMEAAAYGDDPYTAAHYPLPSPPEQDRPDDLDPPLGDFPA